MGDVVDFPQRKTAEVRPNVPIRGLSRVEAATVVGVSASTFDRLVSDGLMPSPRQVYNRVIWDVVEVNQAFDCLPHADSNNAFTASASGW